MCKKRGENEAYMRRIPQIQADRADGHSPRIYRKSQEIPAIA